MLCLLIGVSLSEPHTSESALKCLSVMSVRTFVRLRSHTVNVFFQYCVFSKFGFHIQALALSGVDKHKIARDSSNAERLSRQRLGKL